MASGSQPQPPRAEAEKETEKNKKNFTQGSEGGKPDQHPGPGANKRKKSADAETPRSERLRKRFDKNRRLEDLELELRFIK